MKKTCTLIIFFVHILCCAYTESSSSNDTYKVLSITRHSMRGVPFFNSQEISLSNDLILPNPFLCWDDNISQAGIELVNAKCINACVQMGLKELHLGKWRKEWEEIRTDFLSERTFFTGKILKQKLRDAHIPITAVIDKENPNQLYAYNSTNYDAVTFDMGAGKFSTNVPPFPSNIDSSILQAKTRDFLNWLSLSILKKPFTGELPDVYIDGQLNPFYTTNVSVAAYLISMTSFPQPPLNKIFKNNEYYPHQRDVVKSACKWLNYALTNYYSTQFIVYNSFPIIEFLDHMEFNNKGRIIISHDIRQFQFLRALDIESYPENLPFQSYVIVQSRDQVCLLYTAAKISKQGVYQKPFIKKLIWKGTLGEWQAKIQNMSTYVNPIYPLYPIKEAYELNID